MLPLCWDLLCPSQQGIAGSPRCSGCCLHILPALTRELRLPTFLSEAEMGQCLSSGCSDPKLGLVEVRNVSLASLSPALREPPMRKKPKAAEPSLSSCHHPRLRSAAQTKPHC